MVKSFFREQEFLTRKGTVKLYVIPGPWDLALSFGLCEYPYVYPPCTSANTVMKIINTLTPTMCGNNDLIQTSGAYCRYVRSNV